MGIETGLVEAAFIHSTKSLCYATVIHSFTKILCLSWIGPE